MKGKISRGSGFRGATSYVLDKEGAQLIGGTMSGTDKKSLVREFSVTKSLRPNAKKPVWHCSLSLPPGDKLIDQKWNDIAHDFMHRMGFDDGNHQYFFARHTDTDKDHIHIVASRIGLDGGLWHGRHDVKRAIKITQELEQKHKLTLTAGLVIAEDHTASIGRGELEKTLRTGEAIPKLVIREAIDTALEGKPSTEIFIERLESAGITVRPNIASTGKMNGFSFEFEGTPIKASAMGKKYGFGELQNRGLDYDQNRDFEILKAAKDRSMEASSNEQNRTSEIDSPSQTDQRADRGIEEPATIGIGGTSSADHRAVSVEHGESDGRGSGEHTADQDSDSGSVGSIRPGMPRPTISSRSTKRDSKPINRPTEQIREKPLVNGDSSRDAFRSSIELISSLAATEADMKDRTYQAIQRQLKAMAQKQYEIGIRDAKTGLMMNREWTQKEILQNLAWLKRMNAKGNEIYIRPGRGSSTNLILVDDLDEVNLDQLKEDGLSPALVNETSPGNYQAWLKLPDKADHQARTSIARKIAYTYNADPNSADGQHYGRLAGFTNNKPEHKKYNKQPYVLCRHSGGQISPGAAELLNKVLADRAELKVMEEAQERQRLIDQTKVAGSTKDPVTAYRKAVKEIYNTIQKDPDPKKRSLSRADWHACIKLAKDGFAPDQIKAALNEASPDIATRKAGHVDDYIDRTVQGVENQPEIKKARFLQATEQEKEQARSERWQNMTPQEQDQHLFDNLLKEEGITDRRQMEEVIKMFPLAKLPEQTEAQKRIGGIAEAIKASADKSSPKVEPEQDRDFDMGM